MKGDSLINYSNIFLNYHRMTDSVCHLRIKEHSLVYVYSGEIAITESGHVTRIRPGECAFIRRDNKVTMNKYGSKDTQAYQSIALHFSRKFLLDFYRNLNKGALPQGVKRNKVSVMKMPVRPDIISLFESIKPYFNTNIEPDEEWLRMKMVEGLYTVLRTDKSVYASLFDFTEPWKIDLLGFMNDNYMYDLSLDELATYTGRSLSAFKLDFSKLSDLTPRKWIIRKRLEVAHDLIVLERRKVKEVVLDVGFKNLSHFSRVYKETYGHAPSFSI